MLKKVNENEFKEEIKEGVVVVDFFADWCGPCKMLSPVMESLSEEMNNVNFIKVNVDECGDIAREYRIMNIPTVIMFKDGVKKETIVGFNPKEVLSEKIKQYL